MFRGRRTIKRAPAIQVKDDEEEKDDSYYFTEHILCVTISLLNPHNGP